MVRLSVYEDAIVSMLISDCEFKMEKWSLCKEIASVLKYELMSIGEGVIISKDWIVNV